MAEDVAGGVPDFVAEIPVPLHAANIKFDIPAGGGE